MGWWRFRLAIYTYIDCYNMAEKKGNNNNEKMKKGNENSKPKRRFRINKKLDGNSGIIFIGQEDPFLYFPDMMSYFNRDEHVSELVLLLMYLISIFLFLFSTIDRTIILPILPIPFIPI